MNHSPIHGTDRVGELMGLTVAHLRRALTIGIAALVVILAVLTAGPTARLAGTAAAAPPTTRPSSSSRPAPTAPAVSATETRPDDKTCVGAHFATFGAIYDAVFDSFAPSLPASVRANAPQIRARAHHDMDAIRISSLWVSNHPAAMGAGPDAPMNDYRDPLSQWIVTQLMLVRQGQSGQVITAEQLTLSQAVESVWLYLYITTIIPLTLLKDAMPGIASVGPVSVGTLVTFPLSVGLAVVKRVYKAISNALVDACIVSVTADERDRAGQPVRDLNFHQKVPPIIEDMAGQVMIADPATCPAIGTLPLSRIADRTIGHLAATAADKATAARIAEAGKRLQAFMRSTRVPHNLVPADPDDFSTLEDLTSMGLGLIPTVGGAATDALVGLGHNIADGRDPGEMIPLGDVSVSASLTAAYYVYALTSQVVGIVSDAISEQIVATVLGGADVIPHIGGLVNAPNTYGLVVYHHALRSLCLAEDNRGPAPRW